MLGLNLNTDYLATRSQLVNPLVFRYHVRRLCYRVQRVSMNDEEVLDRLRTICLALPETTEGGGVGNPTFRVRDKIFAMRHPFNERWSMWCKAPPGAQDVLVGSQPDVFFVPPYVGHNGWVGVWLDINLDWDHIRDLIETSYRMTAPKRLLKLLDS